MSKKIVRINEEVIKGQIKELVRGSVGCTTMCYSAPVFKQRVPLFKNRGKKDSE